MNNEEFKIDDLLMEKEDLEKMNFAELSLYIEELNKLENDLKSIEEEKDE